MQPYYNIVHVILIDLLIQHRRERPQRPNVQSLTDEYWSFIQRCWDEPSLRPSAAEAHEALLDLGNAALHPNRI